MLWELVHTTRLYHGIIIIIQGNQELFWIGLFHLAVMLRNKNTQPQWMGLMNGHAQYGKIAGMTLKLRITQYPYVSFIHSFCKILYDTSITFIGME